MERTCPLTVFREMKSSEPISRCESSLTGTFDDQAALHGLLDRLRDLAIPIVSVNPID